VDDREKSVRQLCALLGDMEAHRQQELGAVQRLDLRLVETEDHCAARRVQVQPDDVVDHCGELRIPTGLVDPRAARGATPRCV